MRLSVNWLKDYIDPNLSTEKLVDRLTMAGLEVEGLELVGTDTVFEIEITPNRPDCLSILGLAREIGAITGKSVKYPKINGADPRWSLSSNVLTGDGNDKARKLIHIENKKDCSRYIGTLVRDVRIADSPKEMKTRLASMGIPAINNAVDITNFVLMEMGQPLHAFDYDKLAGGKIVVRRAKSGESIVTLDGIERKLDGSILIIADSQKPVAIAGIMGGRDTQITSTTRNILLESAHFDMALIRRSCRALGLRSDSAYRFERNVNFKGVLTGANRAVDLLLSLTGGRLSARCEASVKTKIIPSKVKVKTSGIESLLGLKITPLKVKAWLIRLGFKVTLKSGILTVTPPDNRADIRQEADVIEEIARMTGFDRLPCALPEIKSANIPADKRPREARDKIRQVLMAGGVDEIITHSMVNARMLAKSGMGDMPAARILNPLNQDQELMRPAMLPSFLQAAMTNINRGQKDLRFFEIGKVYSENAEREALGVLLTGRRSQDRRVHRKDRVEFSDLKGIMDRIFQKTGIEAVYDPVQKTFFDLGCAASIIVDGKPIGVLGRVERKVLNNWDIKNQDIYFAESYPGDIFSKPGKNIKYRPVTEFPAIVRDVSLAVKKDIPYKKIEEICLKEGGDILRSLNLIEEYPGIGVLQPGDKGIVFSCQYQSNTRTLREDEVAAVHERVLQSLTHELAAILR